MPDCTHPPEHIRFSHDRASAFCDLCNAIVPVPGAGKPKAVIVDIDGTLASNEWRSHWVNAEKHISQFHDPRSQFYATTDHGAERSMGAWGGCSKCGTTCEFNEHGDKMINGFPVPTGYKMKHQNWERFYDDCLSDAPIPGVVRILELLRSPPPGFSDRIEIILVSGRDEHWRYPTELWLATHGVSYDSLHMRPEKDSRLDWIIKREIYWTHIEPRFDVPLVIDDRPSVCDMWRDLGLTVLQVQDPGLEPITPPIGVD